jgi:hypothetical protein
LSFRPACMFRRRKVVKIPRLGIISIWPGVGNGPALIFVPIAEQKLAGCFTSTQIRTPQGGTIKRERGRNGFDGIESQQRGMPGSELP